MMLYVYSGYELYSIYGFGIPNRGIIVTMNGTVMSLTTDSTQISININLRSAYITFCPVDPHSSSISDKHSNPCIPFFMGMTLNYFSFAVARPENGPLGGLEGGLKRKWTSCLPYPSGQLAFFLSPVSLFLISSIFLFFFFLQFLLPAKLAVCSLRPLGSL